MTKPIVAVCAMTLVEDGTLRLDDPVDDLLPELADMTVLADPDGPLDDTVPVERPITMRDLLTYTLGTGMVPAEPGTIPIADALDTLGEPPPDEWIRRLGELPLVHQPGERWMYDTAADVTGVLIARATGMSFGDALRERICDPLGMTDTGFCVGGESIDRLATAYERDNAGTGEPVVEEAPDGRWIRPPAFESGGGGLVSTADDLLAFGRMLRSGGDPLLSRATVAAMTTDQLTPAQKEVVAWVPWHGAGWGFGIGVATERVGIDANPGRFGWDGGMGTSFSCDPGEDLVGTLLTQTMWTSPTAHNVVSDFWTATYAALT
jgi:CubicO group peptidase (beta-lactamase class C family)